VKTFEIPVSRFGYRWPKGSIIHLHPYDHQYVVRGYAPDRPSVFVRRAYWFDRCRRWIAAFWDTWLRGD
jgi:hypothetical protein